ncbi:hypothetical protein BH11ARM2_BH11ARM2_12430 [soil metagenome]
MRTLSKALPALLISVVAAFVIGCGGGGGGGSTTDGSTNATSANATTATNATGTTALTSIQAEAYDTATQTVVDAGSVQKGDSLQLRLFGRDDNNNIVYPSGTTWTTNAAASVATVTSSGLLTIKGDSGSFTVTANGRYNLGLTIQAAAEAAVSGKVKNQENQGVPGAIIEIFANNGNKLRSGVTGSDGTFQIAVPSNASKFDVNFANIDTRYVNVWGYGSGTFSPAVCPAIVPLPALTAGHVTSLTRNIVLFRKDDTVPPAVDCEIP